MTSNASVSATPSQLLAARRLGRAAWYVTDNVAQQLREPARVDPRRRGFLPEEAALLRLLARSGQDPLLDELTLSLPERLGLRCIERLGGQRCGVSAICQHFVRRLDESD